MKDPEWAKRGIANKVIVQSSSSKIPRNFSEFLKNGENKTRLIEIIKDVIVINKGNVLRKLGCQEIFYSMDGVCYRITATLLEIFEDLSSNQEVADIKLLLLHANHAVLLDPDGPSLYDHHQAMSTSMFCLYACS